MHRRAYRPTLRYKVWLDVGNRFALGDGGVDLLRAISATGSLRAASAAVGWSYRHTLTYLAQAEAALGYPLVSRTRGGHSRGGTSLSPAGREFLRRYTAFRSRLDRLAGRLYRTAFADRSP